MSNMTSDSRADSGASARSRARASREVALVEDLGQAVDRGEAVDLLVIGVLDVAAREELEDRAADLDEIAVAHDVLVDRSSLT
jgi:hypothetical protein